MTRLFCAHHDYLGHLEAEIDWHKRQMVHERQRAEMALDKLQMLTVGGGPVTVPTPDERASVVSALADLTTDPEFVRAGGLDDD